VWFGTGLKLFPVTYVLDREYTSWIHPHNFVLEYAMGFGVVGLALWLVLMTFWPVRAMRVSRLAAKARAVGVILGLTTFGFVLGASLVQPLMLFPGVLLVFAFAVGVLSRLLSVDTAVSRPGGTEPSRGKVPPAGLGRMAGNVN